jgi:hypothetical protein
MARTKKCSTGTPAKIRKTKRLSAKLKAMTKRVDGKK